MNELLGKIYLPSRHCEWLSRSQTITISGSSAVSLGKGLSQLGLLLTPPYGRQRGSQDLHLRIQLLPITWCTQLCLNCLWLRGGAWVYRQGMRYICRQLHLCGFRETLIPAGLRLTKSFLWQGGALRPPGNSLILRSELWQNCASVCPWNLKWRDIYCLSFSLGKNISNICLCVIVREYY